MPKVRKNRRIWAVYGPSAEWADGWDLIGLAPTRADAQRLIREERMALFDAFGPKAEWPWPYNETPFWAEPVPIADASPLVERIAHDLGVDPEEVWADLL